MTDVDPQTVLAILAAVVVVVALVNAIGRVR